MTDEKTMNTNHSHKTKSGAEITYNPRQNELRLFYKKTPHWRAHGDGSVTLEFRSSRDGSIEFDAGEHSFQMARTVSKRVMCTIDPEAAQTLGQFLMQRASPIYAVIPDHADLGLETDRLRFDSPHALMAIDVAGGRVQAVLMRLDCEFGHDHRFVVYDVRSPDGLCTNGSYHDALSEALTEHEYRLERARKIAGRTRTSTNYFPTERDAVAYYATQECDEAEVRRKIRDREIEIGAPPDRDGVRFYIEANERRYYYEEL